jgi:four helix bundle suffix protein
MRIFCVTAISRNGRPTPPKRWTLYAPRLEHANPAVRANATICLIRQANYLLDQQIAALEKAFIKDGGYSEQLASSRFAERQKKMNPRLRPSRRIAFPPARPAPSPWSSAPPKPARTSANSSGAVQPIPIAKAS